MKLKRKYARLIIVLLGFTLLVCLAIIILGEAGAPHTVMVVLICVATTCVILMLYLRFRLLGCPNCGGSAARPYWNPDESHRLFCPKCGKPFIYDDEPDEV